MLIPAKFKSICPCCEKEILVGETVEWTRGQKAIHKECRNQKLAEQTAQVQKEHQESEIAIGDRVEVLIDIPERAGVLKQPTGRIACAAGTKARVDGMNKVVKNNIEYTMIALSYKNKQSVCTRVVIPFREDIVKVTKRHKGIY